MLENIVSRQKSKVRGPQSPWKDLCGYDAEGNLKSFLEQIPKESPTGA